MGLLLALALLASSYTVPVSSRVLFLGLAGGKPVWLEPRGHGAVVVVAAGGAAHDLAAFLWRPGLIVASGGTVVVDPGGMVVIDVVIGVCMLFLVCMFLRWLWGSVFVCDDTMLIDFVDGMLWTLG